MAKKVNIEIPILPPVEGEKAPSPAMSKVEKKYVGEIDLNILLKFIKPYDGSRDTINSFLTNCNNAYELASESQKFILFKYILSQLQGKAEIAASIKDFTTFEQLKEFLKTQFCQRKHYAHLITDLQESKQLPTENVIQFATKVESILTQLLTEISMNPTKKSEIPGRTAAMEDLALHHFLMGLNPRISNIVRCRSPKNLNEAIGLAISEEKIQQTLYRKTDSQKERKYNNNFQENRKIYRPPQGQQNYFTPKPFQGSQFQRNYDLDKHFERPSFTPSNKFREKSTPTFNQGYQRNKIFQQIPFNKKRINFVNEKYEQEYYPEPYCVTQKDNDENYHENENNLNEEESRPRASRD